MEKPGHPGSDGLEMPNLVQMAADVFQIFVGRHPVAVVESSEVKRQRIGTESFFTQSIVIKIEIRHDQLPDGFVDGFAEAEGSEIRLGYGSPALIGHKDSDDMVIVVSGTDIHH